MKSSARQFSASPLGRWQAAQRLRIAAIKETAEFYRPTAEQADLAAILRAEEGRVKHAAVIRHHAAKRRSAKLQRTPPWADMEKIASIYAEAQKMSRGSGISYHVDHIYPLQGKNLSGLHTHDNLQILTGSENSKKGNRFEAQK